MNIILLYNIFQNSFITNIVIGIKNIRKTFHVVDNYKYLLRICDRQR